MVAVPAPNVLIIPVTLSIEILLGLLLFHLPPGVPLVRVSMLWRHMTALAVIGPIAGLGFTAMVADVWQPVGRT